MSIEQTLDRVHSNAVRNVWLQRFTVVTRILLAVAFIPPGLVKILNIPFTKLPPTHPVGQFFDVFYNISPWYQSVGWAQVIAALLLLFPRTATLGAMVYLPLIINITIITNAVGFQGTSLITNLMLLANIYLLCWDYDKFKALMPHRTERKNQVPLANFLLEPLVFGIGGAAVFALFAFAQVANLQKLGFPGAAAMFTAGCMFGLVCVWHRRNLRVAE